MNAAKRVTANLQELMPRSKAVTVRKGRRVKVTYGGVTATGTIVYGYTRPDTTGVLIELDGTAQRVDVPQEILADIEEGTD